jgi:hypothetical protein
MMKYRACCFLTLVLVSRLQLKTFAQHAEKDTLLKSFYSPPNSARPRVWWHWMNGNITKDGIKKDLLWMHRSGIGGFQNFDAGLITPQIVEKRLTYMTPEWQDAFRFATKLADSLKLEMAIAGSPGWSESGGPWVPAKNGMKKIVWSEVRVKGGQPFNGTLAPPPSVSGDFQNLPIPEAGFSIAEKSAPPPEYYQDIAVVAYRLPSNDVPLSELSPKITSSGGNFTLSQLTDSDLAKTNLLPSDSVKGVAWVQFEFPGPQAIKGLTVVGGGVKSVFGISGPSEQRSLEVSDDGVNFRRITFIPLSVLEQTTISFTPVTARFFRVTFKNPPPPLNLAALTGGAAPKAPQGTPIAEIMLYPATRINHFEEKAGFSVAVDLALQTTPATNDVTAVSDVIDLTGKMTPDGKLNWTPPAGNWKIIRFGYSLTGKQNHPASPEATGLEVDKLDRTAVKDYFDTYLDKYKNATGGLMGKRGLQYMVTDSYEAGQENWTPNMAVEFQKRRGYALLPWMPVLTGAIVKSTDASEKFLWDFRKTISELIAENHYDQLTSILQTYGMKRYSESHENGRTYVVDGMDVKRNAAIPMAAMWAAGGSSPSMSQADIRESASVAHIYGQNLVAAESLTAIGFGGNAWGFSPERLKPTADLELASGLNRFVIHTSAHQPLDTKIPGLGLGPFGQWFNRHETWANQAGVWTDYLARSSYLLQQGKFVADIVYYYGEDNNITGLFGAKLPDIPEGYSYDFINPHALINLLEVKNGKLVTPSGMSYRMLYLDGNARQMSLPVLRKIARLARAGAVIGGVKPESTPSLMDDQQEFSQLVEEVWGSGKANVQSGKSVKAMVSDLNIQPDFSYTSTQGSPNVLFVHRKLPNGEIYWINNRNDTTVNIQASFRVAGKVPEIWHAESGKKEPVSYSIADGRTTVPLELTNNDAVFIVFRTAATKTSVVLPQKTSKVFATLSGSWDVAFQADRGAPATARFDSLISYTRNVDAGIKYFSGTATYTKVIDVPSRKGHPGDQYWLDLGDVKNIAEVLINGKNIGTAWKKPFKVDITNAIKPGKNNLTIKVTNLWVNRLIGDQQPGTTQKITYTTMQFYGAKSPLLPSGLLGPVKIVLVSR